MSDASAQSLTMSDGAALVFRTFRSPITPKAAVIIPCAMGVGQKFYTRFAQWLAGQGYHVTTFDYRGIGFSAHSQSWRSAGRRIEQWRRWCLHREYVVGAEGEQVRKAYASIRTPMLSLSFTDDELISAQGIRSLHELYVNAPVEYHRIAPPEVGVRRIGHFGFFRPQLERTLWPLAAQWLAS